MTQPMCRLLGKLTAVHFGAPQRQNTTTAVTAVTIIQTIIVLDFHSFIDSIGIVCLVCNRKQTGHDESGTNVPTIDLR